MAEQFQHQSIPDDRITPEQAEAIVKRFAERERQQQAEQERLQTLPRIQDLAELFGTTPEDVRLLLQEAESRSRATVAVEEDLKRRNTNWSLVITVAVLGMVLIAVMASAISSPRPGVAVPVTSSSDPKNFFEVSGTPAANE